MLAMAEEGLIDTNEVLMPDVGIFVQSLLDDLCKSARQAQHEATWAMALEAAAKCSKELRDEHKCETMLYAQHHIHVSAIGALPCPPLDEEK